MKLIKENLNNGRETRFSRASVTFETLPSDRVFDVLRQ